MSTHHKIILTSTPPTAKTSTKPPSKPTSTPSSKPKSSPPPPRAPLESASPDLSILFLLLLSGLPIRTALAQDHSPPTDLLIALSETQPGTITQLIIKDNTLHLLTSGCSPQFLRDLTPSDIAHLKSPDATLTLPEARLELEIVSTTPIAPGNVANYCVKGADVSNIAGVMSTSISVPTELRRRAPDPDPDNNAAAAAPPPFPDGITALATAHPDLFIGADSYNDHVSYADAVMRVSIVLTSIDAFAPQTQAITPYVIVSPSDKFIVLHDTGIVAGLTSISGLDNGTFATLATLDGTSGTITHQLHYNGKYFFTSVGALRHNINLNASDTQALLTANRLKGLGVGLDTHASYITAITSFAPSTVLDASVEVTALDKYIILRDDGALEGVTTLANLDMGKFAIVAILDGQTGSILSQLHYNAQAFFTPGGTLMHNVNLDAASRINIVSTYIQGLSISGFGKQDILISIDKITGSPYYDNITGDFADNILDGGAGVDMLQGGGGDDHLIGGSGTDILQGGPGTDILDGGPGTDYANFTYIKLARPPQTLTIDGQTYHFTGIAADLSGLLGDASNPFHTSERDILMNIEHLTGSDYADILVGDYQDNALLGRDGDDVLIGRGGDDRLHGGQGRDMMTGGTGADSFNISDAAPTLDLADVITDFKSLEDSLNIGTLPHVWFRTGMDGDNDGKADDTVIYKGDATTHNAGEILAVLQEYSHDLTTSDFDNPVIVHEIL